MIHHYIRWAEVLHNKCGEENKQIESEVKRIEKDFLNNSRYLMCNSLELWKG